MELDNEDVGKPVSDYFGVSGDAPTVKTFPSMSLPLLLLILRYSGSKFNL